MEQLVPQDVFFVASQRTRQVLYTQPLSAEWFRHELVERTIWSAALVCSGLRGGPVVPAVSTVTSRDGDVSGWEVTLSVDGEVRYRRSWPVSVLHATALAIGHQFQPWLADGRVVYWVSREDPCPSLNGATHAIDFDGTESDNAAVTVPHISTRSATGDVLARANRNPPDAVLELSSQAHRVLMAGIGDNRYFGLEIAWLGVAEVGYAPQAGVLSYHVASLQRLATPDATATLCPVDPHSLVNALQGNQPVVFIHTHVVPDTWDPARDTHKHLGCSQDDLVCFHRLPVGSLCVIAGSRPPLGIRAYGWSAKADDLTILDTNVHLQVTKESVSRREDPK